MADKYKLIITTPTSINVSEPFTVQFTIDQPNGLPPLDPDTTHGQALVTGYPDGHQHLSLPELIGPKGKFCTINNFAPGESSQALSLKVRLVEIPLGQQDQDTQQIKISRAVGPTTERLRRWKRGDYGGGVITITSPAPGSAVAAPFSATGTLAGTPDFNVSGLLTTAMGGQYGPSSISPGPNWSMTFNNPPGNLPNATLRVWYAADPTHVFAQETFGGSDVGGKSM
jgi:hypothetical protein